MVLRKFDGTELLKAEIEGVLSAARIILSEETDTPQLGEAIRYHQKNKGRKGSLAVVVAAYGQEYVNQALAERCRRPR